MTLKRLYLTLGLALCLLAAKSEAEGDSHPEKKLGYGFRFASNNNWGSMSNFFFNPDSIKSEFGFSFGGTLQYKIGDGWDLALDILASRTSLFFLSNQYTVDAYEFKFWSLDFPLVLYYSPIKQLFLGIGGYTSLGVGDITRLGSYTQFGSFAPRYVDDSVSYDSQNWNKLSFGGVLAVGTSTPFGTTNNEAYFEARLYWGFSNRLNTAAAQLYNRSVEFGAGMIF